jgi:enediyne biosynthesis protein E4
VASGLAKLPGGYGHGVAVGDYDNDGRPDLFVTRWRSYALYHNAGQGRFEDATAAAGLGGDRDWPTSAAWADLDNDGDLDLYVCHYLKWDEFNPRICEYTGKPEKGNNYCDPRAFPSLPDHFFRNDGGRFVDVTAETGVVDQEGRGLGVIAADFDSDGLTDLFVANDTSANYYLHNRGGFRFSEEGLESGLAASASGGYLAGMGVAYADFEGDGQLDVAVTNFLNESTTLYHNHGGGVFSDRSADSGIAVATRLVLGFGLAALDANNDGYPDLVQVNGHVSDNRPLLPYAMPAQLLLNDGAGRFVDVSDRAGPSWRIPRLGRGLAVGDFDNDGRIDVVIVSENAPLELLHNECSSQNHSLTLLLEGRSSNRDAVAARVAVTAAGQTRVAARFGGGSYQSASDQRLHFGLGTAVAAERVEVTWPSGRRDCYQGLAADSAYRLREGDSSASPLPGFAAYDRKR